MTVLIRKSQVQGKGLSSVSVPSIGRQDDALDAIAAEIMGQVSKLRGLPFQGQVRARYANREDLTAYLSVIESSLFGPERKVHDQWVASLLGLIDAGTNLEKVQTELLMSQVGGFYDPASKTFYVMEGFEPDLVRIIMAHELVHALDDQHYDLLGAQRRLKDSTDRLYALHAVAEGSAQTVMGMWIVENLAKLDRRALTKAQEQMDMGAFSKAPRLVWQPMIALYNQGQAFLERRTWSPLPKRAEMQDLKTAFQSLPRSTEQVLHPAKYWKGEAQLDEPIELRHTHRSLPDGWRGVHTDVLGELIVALLTQSQSTKVTQASIMGLSFTHKEASGWGGDRLTLLRNGEAAILVMDTVWDSSKDAQEFHGGLLKSPRNARIVQVHGEDRVRMVAWSGISQEGALEVAAKVECSRVSFAKIPAPTNLPPEGPSHPDKGDSPR